MNDVAIVILNFNGENFLNQFLPIVIKNTPAEAQIIVADNASTDQSISVLTENFPSVSVIKLAKNYGFAEGYNQALKKVQAKYFVLLNSDVEVTENWLPPLINTLKKESVVACQPKVKAFYQKDAFEYAGAAGGFLDRFGYPFCRGRIIDHVELDNGQYDDEIKIFWATGACLAIRSDSFFEAGGFDGDFFAHMEEIDLCWRLQLLGYSIGYTSKSTVYHVGGGTLQKTNSFKTFLNFRNGLFMLYKNLPDKGFYRTILGRLILDGLAGLSYLPKGQFSNFFAVIKAHFAFYLSINQLRPKRKLLKNQAKIQLATDLKINKSLVAEYLKNRNLLFKDLSLKLNKL